jgi:sulfonate transport system substrate-binding protein
VQGEIVLRALESQGLGPEDVTLVELPSSSADIYVNALSGGLIDVAPIGAGAALKRYLDRFGKDGAKAIHSGFRDDFVTLYVREETLRDPAKAAALAAYVRVWGRAQAWINRRPDEWAKVYYEANQGLSPADARYVVQANGKAEVPRDWSLAIARQQASIELMAQATGRKPFAAERLFDRRFEALSADAFAKAGGGPTLTSR